MIGRYSLQGCETIILLRKKYLHIYGSEGIPGDFVDNLVQEVNTLRTNMKEKVYNIVTEQELQEIQFLQEFTKNHINLIKK